MRKIVSIVGVGILSITLSCHAESLESIYEAPAAPVAGHEVSPPEFVRDAFEAANKGVEVVFPYIPHNVFKIYTQEGFVTDIGLEPGEVLKYVGGGDTLRWKIDIAEAGSYSEKRMHIFVKPLQAAISTNLVINTDRRVYQLIIESGNLYNPMVRWTFPKSDIEKLNEKKIKSYSNINPALMKFGYKISDKSVKWAPENAFRSGTKTYFKMKADIVNSELPTFFVLDDEDKPILVSYRYLNGYFIVDRLVDKGVFVLGKKQIKISYKG